VKLRITLPLMFAALLLAAPLALHALAEDDASGVSVLVDLLAENDDPDLQRDLLTGMMDALKGQRSVAMPKSWPKAYARLSKSSSAEVREIFKVPRIGMVAGCHVIEGVIGRNANVRLLRDNVVVYTGKLSSLRRFKDDVSEVRAGQECGITLHNYNDIKQGDEIELFQNVEVAQELNL